MSSALSRFQGPIFMVLSSAFYVANDTLMKLATEGMPPYQALFLRGLFATLWGVPLVLALGHGRRLGAMLHRSVLVRNGFELGSILCFVVALANMPIADATALMQITPLLMLLGASALFGERLGVHRAMLVALGFVGAILVARPSAGGISAYAILALMTAVFSAARDLAGRRVPAGIAGMVVALGACLVVLVGAGVAHVTLEVWTKPGAYHLSLLAGAGLLLFAGHFFVFMAYRVGSTATVAPFFYFFTFWAMVSGLVVFGDRPDALSLAGIALVVVSGLAVVLLGERQRRLLPTA